MKKIILFIICLFTIQLFSAEIVEIIEIERETKATPVPSILPYQTAKRPKIGLALSGGGLRGLAHIGVIKAFEENDIPIDYIVGTSIGALIGGLYASGYSADEIYAIVQRVDFSQVLNDSPQRSSLFLGEKQKRGRAIVQFRLDNFSLVLPEAYTPGQRLSSMLTDIILDAPYHSQNFDNLAVPLRIIATDVLSGQKVVFKEGDLVEAMRASIAIPLLLSPVDDDQRLLLDGGILNNIPVEDAIECGADIVVAVNATSPLRTKEEMRLPWEVADQVTTIMQQQQNAIQQKLADVVISLADIKGTSTDQEMASLFYNLGYVRTLEQLDKIKNTLKSPNFVEQQNYNISRIKYYDNDQLLKATLVDTIISPVEILSELKKFDSAEKYKNVHANISLVDSSQAFLNFYHNRNPVLSSVQFSGNTIYADSVLGTCFDPMLGKCINLKEWQNGCKNILKLYRDGGYSLAEITRVDFDENSGQAQIVISEGIVREIKFHGKELTRNFVLTREFGMAKNSVFKKEQLRRGIDNLLGTGLFTSVNLELEPIEHDYILRIHIVEKTPIVVRFGSAFDREREARSFIEISHENMFGTANDFTLFGQYGDRDQSVYADYRMERIFKTLLTSRVNFNTGISDHYIYDQGEKIGEYRRSDIGSIFSLGRHIERFGTVWGFMQFNDVSLTSVDGIEFEQLDYLVNTIGLRVVVDTRDQVPFPTKGRFYEFYYEGSDGQILGADFSFIKVRNNLETFVTLGKRHTFCGKFLWGTSDLTTPYSEQFRTGGQNSFYGLDDEELFGRHLIVGNWEYRYKLPVNWLFDTFLSLRFDVGGGWQNIDDIKAQGVITGKGVSWSMKTPLGPLSLAYGEASNSKKRFYFSVGYNF